MEIIPESIWSDRANRILIDDDFLLGSGSALITNGIWAAQNSGNAGSAVGNNQAGPTNFAGGLLITCAATAIGDWEAVTVPSETLFSPGAGRQLPFYEARLYCGLDGALSNLFFEVGLWDTTVNNLVAWVADTALGTTWRIRSTVGGVSTTSDTGITVDTGTAHRLGLSFINPLTGVAGLVGMYDGQSIQGAGSFAMSSISNLPAGTVQLYPYARVGSRVAAAAKRIQIDYIRLLANR